MNPSKPASPLFSQQRKPGPSTLSGRPSVGPDVLQVLVFCKLLSPDQFEPIRSFEELSKRTLKQGHGCLHCRQTGYSGRDGIFEILPITDTICRLISEQADSVKLFDAARVTGK